MTSPDPEPRSKLERSPSFPFISLKKAIERATLLWEGHRREAARLITVAPTWGYSAKSSGLLQTVAALKQFGLIEDFGSGDERKIQLSDLARRIISDQRPGAKETALKEAALKPKLFSEYTKWIGDPPSESHCLSELELDRGFTPEAARTFLRSFFETANFAGLTEEAHESDPQDSLPSPTETRVVVEKMPEFGAEFFGPSVSTSKPFSQRFKVEVTANALSVSAVLLTAEEVDTLIKILGANRPLLEG